MTDPIFTAGEETDATSPEARNREMFHAPHPIEPTPTVALPLIDIIGRDGHVAELWRLLEHSSIRINEVRRSGKSTALRLLAERKPEGWICAIAQVQGVRTADEFVAIILGELLRHASVPERLKSVIQQFARTVKSVKVLSVGYELADDFKDRPWGAMRQVMDSVNAELEDSDQHLVLILDEFPDALRAIAKIDADAAHNVLGLFRSARDGQSGARVRWLLTGSIGLHHVVRDLPGHGETMTDVIVASLPPLDPHWARHLACCYFLGIGRVPDASAAALIADLSDGIPFVLAMMVNELRQRNWRYPTTLTEANNLLLSAAANAMWNDAWTPLLVKVDDYYEAHAALANAVLDLLAIQPRLGADIKRALRSSGVQFSDKEYGDVLGLLRDDHFLSREATVSSDGPGRTTYGWRFNSLRTVWLARRDIEST